MSKRVWTLSTPSPARPAVVTARADVTLWCPSTPGVRSLGCWGVQPGTDKCRMATVAGKKRSVYSKDSGCSEGLGL